MSQRNIKRQTNKHIVGQTDKQTDNSNDVHLDRETERVKKYKHTD